MSFWAYQSKKRSENDKKYAMDLEGWEIFAKFAE